MLHSIQIRDLPDHYVDSGKPAPAQAFATLIEGMDKSLGDILDHLDALGIADNTLIFFLGDNGSDAPLGHQHEVACAAPLRGRRRVPITRGGMRVPFIAAWAKADKDNPAQKRFADCRGSDPGPAGGHNGYLPPRSLVLRIRRFRPTTLSTDRVWTRF